MTGVLEFAICWALILLVARVAVWTAKDENQP